MAYRLITPKNTEEPQGKFKIIPPTKEDKDERTYLQKTQDTLKPLAKYAAIGGKELASAVGGTLGTLEDVAALIGDYLGEKFNLPGKDYTSTRTFPNAGEVRQFIEEKRPFTKTERSSNELFGEGSQEKFAEAAELYSNLINPFLGGGVGAAKAAVGTLTGLGAKEISKQFGASDETQDAVKALSSIIPLIIKGNFKASTKELKAIYDYGKSIGLAEEELAPLLQSQRKQNILGKYANVSQKTKDVISSAKGKVSQGLEDISTRAENLPNLTRQQSTKIGNAFYDVLKDLKLSRLPTEDKIQAIKKVENLLREGNFKAPELIETYRDANKILGRGGAGQKPIAKVKDAIHEALEEIDPNLASDFKLSNALYKKFKTAEKTFSQSEFKKVKEIVEDVGALGSLVHGVVTGNFTEIVTVLGYKATRKAAEKLLTDPKWQSIHRNALRALKEQSPKAIASVGQQIKDEAEKEESS